jgi:hypothetical protein
MLIKLNRKHFFQFVLKKTIMETAVSLKALLTGGRRGHRGKIHVLVFPLRTLRLIKILQIKKYLI